MLASICEPITALISMARLNCDSTLEEGESNSVIIAHLNEVTSSWINFHPAPFRPKTDHKPRSRYSSKYLGNESRNFKQAL